MPARPRLCNKIADSTHVYLATLQGATPDTYGPNVSQTIAKSGLIQSWRCKPQVGFAQPNDCFDQLSSNLIGSTLPCKLKVAAVPPVGLILLVLLIVDSSHLLADSVSNLLNKGRIPCGRQPNWLGKESSFLAGVPGLPHAMKALYKHLNQIGMVMSYRKLVWWLVGWYVEVTVLY